MFINIPGLYSLDARSTPCPRYDNQNCLQMNVPWEANSSLVKSHCSRAIHKGGIKSSVTTVGTRAQPDLVAFGFIEVLDLGAQAGHGKRGARGAERQTTLCQQG